MIGAIRLSWTDALLLIAGYVALDWMSFFHPLHGQYITPWNPAPALALVFILRYGWQAVLLLAVAVLFAEIGVRSLPASLPASVAIALMLALGYGAIGEALRRRLRGPTIFLDRFGLLRWAGIVVAGTLLTSVAFVLALVARVVVLLEGWR